MNDKTLKCIILPADPLVAATRVARGVSREIGDIHANALCEKYGNNIAEAKQNSLPLHVKYTREITRILQPPAFSPSYSSLRSCHDLGQARPRFAFTPFLFFKAPHLPRSRERTPDPADDAD